jgi:hypothetical protein
MKLREPLQGIKMMEGHIIMHLSMFAVSLFIDDSQYKQGSAILNDIELTSMQLLRWGHLASAIFQIAATKFKLSKSHFFAKMF